MYCGKMSKSLYIKICIVYIATCIYDLLILIIVHVYVFVVCPVRAPHYGKNKFYSILFYSVYETTITKQKLIG